MTKEISINILLYVSSLTHIMLNASLEILATSFFQPEHE
jgi:hypothetical protein